jgi:hypothetical protein
MIIRALFLFTVFSNTSFALTCADFDGNIHSIDDSYYASEVLALCAQPDFIHYHGPSKQDGLMVYRMPNHNIYFVDVWDGQVDSIDLEHHH